MADLITLPEYRAYAGIDPSNTSQDARITALIPGASEAIRAWTARDFGTSTVTEERTFMYDFSGFLDIDDAAAITQVALSVPWGADYVLEPEQWIAMPSRRDDQPVFYYILMPDATYGVSGEMGFTRNLDIAIAEGRYRSAPPTVKVTASWGWPVVPLDVKMATYWTIQDWISKSSGDGLASESIESYARSWAQNVSGEPNTALPGRVQDVLARYTKINA